MLLTDAHIEIRPPPTITIYCLSPGIRKRDATPALLPLPPLTGYTYLGCYKDNQGGRIMSMKASRWDMTAEVTCLTRSVDVLRYNYFGGFVDISIYVTELVLAFPTLLLRLLLCCWCTRAFLQNAKARRGRVELSEPFPYGYGNVFHGRLQGGVQI